jgi:DHA2 family multidrug resistance protein-like MFS transporter
VVLALPALLVSLDLSVLLLALPEISKELDAGATEQLWITDAYGFLVAGFLATMGTLGDRIGRRRLLLAGGGAFAVLSITLPAWSATARTCSLTAASSRASTTAT